MFLRKITPYFSLIIILLLSSFNAHAQISVSKMFNNRMVLQRDIEIPVWGWGETGTEVNVTFADSIRTTVVDSSGRWKVFFPAKEAGGPYTMQITSGEQSYSYSDILIGDVFLVTGQSNMEWRLSNATGGELEAATANFPDIRQFKIPKSTATEISEKLSSGSWTKANTYSSTAAFSAVAYYFAKDIYAQTGVPIGLINNTYGGARIEAFMSEQMLGYDEKDRVIGSGVTEQQPTLIYNKMVHPILQARYKGWLWYQGETNGYYSVDALAYEEQFQTMITAIRDSIGQGDLPTIWVQTQNFDDPPGDKPSTRLGFPELRASLSAALALPNTGEALAIDLGTVTVHPPNKKPVGERLALVARKLIYGEDIVASGPRYRSNTLADSGRVIISFDEIGSGLVARGSENGELYMFAIAGEDEDFEWANAVLDGDKVVIWHDDIPEPLYIRFAWEFNPQTLNLYNVEGLPAAPFKAEINPGFKIGKFVSARTAIEEGQSTSLNWKVYNASSITLDGEPVDSVGTKQVSPDSTTTYSLIAVNRDNPAETDTAFVTVEVLDPTQTNRALGRPVTASTFENCCSLERVPEFAVDGDLETRWSSAWSDGTGSTKLDPNYDGNADDEWISIDLGAYYDLNRVILQWEGAYGSAYDVQISLDGFLWRTVYEERSGNGGEDNITLDTPATGRYLKIQGIQRATKFGYSLFEIAAYGAISAIEPPTISLDTDFGNLVGLGSTSATVNAEIETTISSVKNVQFYANEELIGTDTEAPYSTDVTIGDLAEYSISAIVTDNDDIQVQSAPFIIYVDQGNFTRLEAENAELTDGATVEDDASTSGKKYVKLKSGWSMTFPKFTVANPGKKLVNIRYQLTYASPKYQYLVVDGDTLQNIKFTAPDKTSWLNKVIPVEFDDSESHEIAIHTSWGWMSIDYIEVSDLESIVANEEESQLPTSVDLKQNYPNPFNPTTQISFQLPSNQSVELNVYDSTGRLVQTLLDGEKTAGSHTLQFDASNLASGVYFYRLMGNFGTKTRQMVLIK